MQLAIETSSLVSSVALGDSKKLYGELTVQAGLTHSEQLVPHIDMLLAACGKKKQDLTSIAVSIGPGSFTGLRIGLATAKMMAFALQIPIVGISTMEVLAYQGMYADRLIAVHVDAQKKMVYEALYRFQGTTLEVVQEPVILPQEEALQKLLSRNEKVLFMGDGAILGEKRIIAAQEGAGVAAEDFCLAPPTLRIPRAGALLEAAKERTDQGLFDDVVTLVPFYMRKSEAEVLWEKRHGGEA